MFPARPSRERHRLFSVNYNVSTRISMSKEEAFEGLDPVACRSSDPRLSVLSEKNTFDIGLRVVIFKITCQCIKSGRQGS